MQLEENKWIAFFHSSVEHNQRIRRYSMTPYIFNRNKILSIGKTIFASTSNPIVDVQAMVTWWHPIVVFPMGLIREGSDFLVSLGVNDMYTSILRIPEEWMMDQTPIDQFRSFETKYLFWAKCSNYMKFSTYKLLKVGGQGTQIVATVSDPDHYAWIKENYSGIQWLTEQDYMDLIK